MSSGRSTHWCYQCRRSFRHQPRSEPACPGCGGGFIQELSEMEDFANPLDFFGVNPHDERIRRSGAAEALAAMMWNFTGDRGPRGVDFGGTEHRAMDFGPGPWLFFRDQPPFRVFYNDGRVEVVFPGGGGGAVGPGYRMRRLGMEDFYLGSGLEELIELLARNNRAGPPPAPRSAIDALPTIRINQGHLHGDPHCPVCKEKFELGSEAREMPCKHLYHSDCITPWLALHNSCPVCRHGLSPPQRADNRSQAIVCGPSSGSGTDEGSRAYRNSGVDGSSSRDGSGGQTQGGRNPLSFLWPFSSSHSGGGSHMNEAGGPAAMRSDDDHGGYSGWPFQ